MKYNDNGEYKDIYVKAFDTLPVGTEVDFDGSTVPSGWTEVADPNEYSTTEKVIGKWINGKPLYRKVIDLGSNVTINAGDWTSSNKTLPNCKIIINSYACKEADATSQIRATIGTNDIIMIMNPASFAIVVRYIIVEYTKTTD